MDDLIRVRSGDLNGRTEMPRLRHAETINGKKLGSELGFRIDEEALYIGTENGNVRLCGAGDVERITALEAKKTTLEGQIETIMARLEALETPSE